MLPDFSHLQDEQFDLAEISGRAGTHADLVGKTFLIESVEPTTTEFGEAFNVTGKIIENKASFAHRSELYLFGAIALVSALKRVRNPYLIPVTIGKEKPKSGQQEYYLPVTTPAKLLELIHDYRLSVYDDFVNSQPEAFLQSEHE